jgi:hypothetical protein
MLLLLSQTITSAKILLTPGNTDQNTDRPVPVYGINTDTGQAAGIKTVYNSNHKCIIKLQLDFWWWERGVVHSTPTNQKPSNAPIFVHSSAGRMAAGRHPGRRPLPPLSSRRAPPRWRQRHRWQQQWWGAATINNQQSTTRGGGGNSNGNCDNSNDNE